MKQCILIFFLTLQLGLMSLNGQNFEVKKANNCFIDSLKIEKTRLLNNETVRIAENGLLKIKHIQNYDYQFRGPKKVNLDSLNTILRNRTEMIYKTIGSDFKVSECKNPFSFQLIVPESSLFSDTTKTLIRWTHNAEVFYAHIKTIFDEYVLIEKCEGKNYEIDFSKFSGLPEQSIIFFVTGDDSCDYSEVYGFKIQKSAN